MSQLNKEQKPSNWNAVGYPRVWDNQLKLLNLAIKEESFKPTVLEQGFINVVHALLKDDEVLSYTQSSKLRGLYSKVRFSKERL